MLIADITDFLQAAPSGRLLALDHGTKTIGLAISDAERSLAVPMHTIQKKRFMTDGEALMSVVTQREVTGLVIGYPLNMDGSEGPRCQSVRAFVRNLENLCNLPMLLWDERLTTDAAMDAMKEAGIRTNARKGKRDAAAATLILQGMLDNASSL